jgi:hypothetical protein
MNPAASRRGAAMPKPASSEPLGLTIPLPLLARADELIE